MSSRAGIKYTIPRSAGPQPSRYFDCVNRCLSHSLTKIILLNIHKISYVPHKCDTVIYIYIYIYIYIHTHTHTHTQSVPGGKDNILRGHSIGYSKQKRYMNMCPIPNGFRDTAILVVWLGRTVLTIPPALLRDGRSVFWEVIVSVILSKKSYKNVCPSPNGFRDRAI
jgi:hypothetical protein